MKISFREIFELFVASFVIGFILAFPYLNKLLIFLFVALLSFALHELAHKFAAQKFGLNAEFKVWPAGLFGGAALTIFLNLLGIPIKIAAPGAVIISQYVFSLTKSKISFERIGMISAAGPLINLAFAILFLLIKTPFSAEIVTINAFLAFFNLLPIKPLDGSKIFIWKPWIWFLMVVISIMVLI